MGDIKRHNPVKYFCAVTFNDIFITRDELETLLVSRIKPLDIKSETFLFDRYTNYYRTEMGDKLQKFFLGFAELLAADYLPELKIITNRLEQEFLHNDKRSVNCDPGYITEAKMVIATTKDYSHRIYLGEGIFADLHYSFREKSFHPNPWTYPDYQREASIHFFNKLRQTYREQLNGI